MSCGVYLMTATEYLQQLGWRNFFDAQLADHDRNYQRPARVMAVHRGRVDIAGDGVPAAPSINDSANPVMP